MNHVSPCIALLVCGVVPVASACSDVAADAKLDVRSDAVTGAELYVSPDGSDTNPGTKEAPLRSIDRGYALASPGTTVLVRGGVYAPTTQVLLSRSGQEGNPIRVFAYPGERPVLDGAKMTEQWEKGIPLRITGAFNHVRGFEIKNGPEGGATIEGANNVLEALDVHHNGRLSDYEGKGITVMGAASNNLVLNCDSHHNRDRNLGNADGFHVGATGVGNVLRGNRAWRNSDDGYDMWNGASALLDGNWSFENGFDDAMKPLGDGNGFKLGGHHAGKSSGGHTVRNNVAWGNKQNGFDENQASRAMMLDNNTAFRNGSYEMGFWNLPNRFRNNFAFGGRIAVSGTSTTNSWDVCTTCNASVFASVDDAVARGPRAADGTLPASAFLRPATGSAIVDRGTPIGLPFAGNAPDLGAYELGMTEATPSTPPPPSTPTTSPPATSPPTTPTLSLTNLVRNGSFERGDAAWEDWGNTSIDDGDASAGSSSLRVGPGEGGRGQKVALSAGRRYLLTFSAKAQSPRDESCYAGISFRDANGVEVTPEGATLHVTATSWSPHRATIDVPSTAASAKVWVWKDAGVERCWFDAFRVVAQ